MHLLLWKQVNSFKDGEDNVDTSTAIGKLMVTISIGIEEFEMDLIKERQLEGKELVKKCRLYIGALQSTLTIIRS